MIYMDKNIRPNHFLKIMCATQIEFSIIYCGFYINQRQFKIFLNYQCDYLIFSVSKNTH